MQLNRDIGAVLCEAFPAKRVQMKYTRAMQPVRSSTRAISSTRNSEASEVCGRPEKCTTFEISSQDAPDCCTLFMPRNPETHAKLADVEAAEAAYPGGQARDISRW